MQMFFFLFCFWVFVFFRLLDLIPSLFLRVCLSTGLYLYLNNQISCNMFFSCFSSLFFLFFLDLFQCLWEIFLPSNSRLPKISQFLLFCFCSINEMLVYVVCNPLRSIFLPRSFSRLLMYKLLF